MFNAVNNFFGPFTFSPSKEPDGYKISDKFIPRISYSQIQEGDIVVTVEASNTRGFNVKAVAGQILTGAKKNTEYTIHYEIILKPQEGGTSVFEVAHVDKKLITAVENFEQYPKDFQLLVFRLKDAAVRAKIMEVARETANKGNPWEVKGSGTSTRDLFWQIGNYTIYKGLWDEDIQFLAEQALNVHEKKKFEEQGRLLSLSCVQFVSLTLNTSLLLLNQRIASILNSGLTQQQKISKIVEYVKSNKEILAAGGIPHRNITSARLTEKIMGSPEFWSPVGVILKGSSKDFLKEERYTFGSTDLGCFGLGNDNFVRKVFLALSIINSEGVILDNESVQNVRRKTAFCFLYGEDVNIHPTIIANLLSDPEGLESKYLSVVNKIMVDDSFNTKRGSEDFFKLLESKSIPYTESEKEKVEDELNDVIGISTPASYAVYIDFIASKVGLSTTSLYAYGDLLKEINMTQEELSTELEARYQSFSDEMVSKYVVEKKDLTDVLQEKYEGYLQGLEKVLGFNSGSASDYSSFGKTHTTSGLYTKILAAYKTVLNKSNLDPQDKEYLKGYYGVYKVLSQGETSLTISALDTFTSLSGRFSENLEAFRERVKDNTNFSFRSDVGYGNRLWIHYKANEYEEWKSAPCKLAEGENSLWTFAANISIKVQFKCYKGLWDTNSPQPICWRKSCDGITEDMVFSRVEIGKKGTEKWGVYHMPPMELEF